MEPPLKPFIWKINCFSKKVNNNMFDDDSEWTLVLEFASCNSPGVAWSQGVFEIIMLKTIAFYAVAKQLHERRDKVGKTTTIFRY